MLMKLGLTKNKISHIYSLKILTQKGKNSFRNAIIKMKLCFSYLAHEKLVFELFTTSNALKFS